MADDGWGKELGTKQLGNAVENTVKGIGTLLSRICSPAADEAGLWLRDYIHHYRKENIASLERKTEQKLLAFNPGENLHASPQIASKIIEEASWIEDEVVQEMWAGLLSSSCTEEGDDDSNLLFINLLSQLTKAQARILRHACVAAEKVKTPIGLVTSTGHRLHVEFDELAAIAEESDIHRLDREIDYLRELGLLDAHSGFDNNSYSASLTTTPTALALQLFIRCEGSREPPDVFYGRISAENRYRDHFKAAPLEVPDSDGPNQSAE